MAVTKPTEKEIAFTKTTDANGWTKYDYGTWQEYRKTVSASPTIGTGGATAVTLSSSNLPTGMSTLSSNYLSAGFMAGGSAYAYDWNFEMTTVSSALNITVGNKSAGTVSGNIYWHIVIVTP